MCLQERWQEFFDFFFLMGLMWARASALVCVLHRKTVLETPRFLL
jgi:hypothetical protein